jgi:hypothetical protein
VRPGIDDLKDTLPDAGMSAKTTRAVFVVLWCVLLAGKLWLAASLQPFGDEAFYAQESRHLAWAYSDLPGLTAWLARAGTAIGGPGIFAIRLPFLLLGALIPWLVVRIGARWFGAEAGWQAGLLALLLPLSGWMGVLALPDVPMVLAALLCLDASAGLLQRRSPGAFVQLAIALTLGALAHYRFALVIVAGAAGLLCVPAGRALLRDWRMAAALAVGALAWWPLLAWNVAHAGAGLEFQLIDRHPWQPQWQGLGWLPAQAIAVTPGLFVALLATLWVAWRRRREPQPAWPLLLGTGGVAVVGYFVLGFFADSERVSFHWPLAGWLALCCAAPAVLAAWPAWARRTVTALAAIGWVAAFAIMGVLTRPAGREWLAATAAYPDNFAGWNEIADSVGAELAGLPPDTVLVADNFMLGAQLALALGRDDIIVLEHPLNAKHGRRAQLADWGLLSAGREDWRAGPVLLVVEDTARSLKDRLRGYRELCARSGGFGAPRIVNVDQGRKRFLVWQLPRTATGTCQLPALAWIDRPLPGAVGGGRLAVSGWALKAGAGLARVELTLDGVVVATADYGERRGDVLTYWGLDPEQEDSGVGFHAELDLRGHPPGRAWLGLRLHGHDGVVEDWPAQPLQIAP